MQTPGEEEREEEEEVEEDAEEEDAEEDAANEEVPLSPSSSPPTPVVLPLAQMIEPSSTVVLQPEDSAALSTQTPELASGPSIGLVAMALFGLMVMIFGIVSWFSLRRNRPHMTEVQIVEGEMCDEEDDDSVIQRNVPMEDFTEIDDDFDALRQPRRLAL